MLLNESQALICVYAAQIALNQPIVTSTVDLKQINLPNHLQRVRNDAWTIENGLFCAPTAAFATTQCTSMSSARCYSAGDPHCGHLRGSHRAYVSDGLQTWVQTIHSPGGPQSQALAWVYGPSSGQAWSCRQPYGPSGLQPWSPGQSYGPSGLHPTFSPWQCMCFSGW